MDFSAARYVHVVEISPIISTSIFHSGCRTWPLLRRCWCRRLPASELVIRTLQALIATSIALLLGPLTVDRFALVPYESKQLISELSVSMYVRDVK